tara:strand:+ start:181 stop:363 length:183 start_codon:yes stop_codon:yes gene_type:complete
MSDLATELVEIKNLLHGLRLDLNHLAKAQGLPILTHQQQVVSQRQRLADMEIALQAIRKQ